MNPQRKRRYEALAWLWLALSLGSLLTAWFWPTAVSISWETASEQATAGFHLSRSQTADGPFARITATPLPAQGNAASGAQYRFVDRSVTPGVRYFYLLEEVELDQTIRPYPHHIQPVHAPRWPVWTWPTVLTSSAAALFFFYRSRATMNDADSVLRY